MTRKDLPPNLSPDRPETEKEPLGGGKMLRIGSDFSVTIVVCGGLGWWMDQSFGMAPWGLLGMVFLGFAAGLLNMARALGGYRETFGWQKPAQTDEKRE